MHAAFIKAPFEVRFSELPDLVPKQDEVLIKNLLCGICGTDIHLARALAEDWQLFGHEVVGRVLEVGADAGACGLRAGDLVVVESSTKCGACKKCREGEPWRCQNIIGWRGGSGFSENTLVHWQSLHKLENMNIEDAVLAEPLDVAMDLVERAEVSSKDTVAIIGAGPIGLMAAAVVREKVGAKYIYLIDSGTSPARLALGKKLGADRAINLKEEEPIDVVLKDTGGFGVDKILVTAPPKAITEQAFKIASYGAIIAYIGIGITDELYRLEFDANWFHYKKLQLRAAHAVPCLHFEEALKFIADGYIRSADFVTHKFNFKNLKAALGLVSARSDNVIKAVVRIG